MRAWRPCPATGASTTSPTGACSSSAQQYPALQITKDDIWHYIYGFLHAPDYREKYRADLSKDLPRIPFAPDFGAFRDAGEQLAALHLGYETCPEYELQVEVSGGPNPYQLDSSKMQWDKGSDRSVLHVTPSVTLRGIPAEAHGYVVNGRTPLEWAVDRLHIARTRIAASSTTPTPGSPTTRPSWWPISNAWCM